MTLTFSIPVIVLFLVFKTAQQQQAGLPEVIHTWTYEDRLEFAYIYPPGNASYADEACLALDMQVFIPTDSNMEYNVSLEIIPRLQEEIPYLTLWIGVRFTSEMEPSLASDNAPLRFTPAENLQYQSFYETYWYYYDYAGWEYRCATLDFSDLMWGFNEPSYVYWIRERCNEVSAEIVCQKDISPLPARLHDEGEDVAVCTIQGCPDWLQLKNCQSTHGCLGSKCRGLLPCDSIENKRCGPGLNNGVLLKCLLKSYR